jgi:tetratricopeptide (TPR) repeat protein
MDPSQIDALVQRLVSNPHDQEALAQAHQSGTTDPKSYALLLERVGTETRDPAYASHWLSEAANVWSTTVGDAHRAARVLMQAIDRDPTQKVAADRLTQLYRDKGDFKAVVALLERRAKALSPLAAQNARTRQELAGMHEELGRLWKESLQQPKKALENFRRAMDLDPTNASPIAGAREIYKALGQWDDVQLMNDAELALERDPQRKLTMLREEAATKRGANDLAGASQALARALDVGGQDDPSIKQEYGSLIVERVSSGEDVPAKERNKAAEALASLAEMYDGEHGLAYSAGALDIRPGHDRALQLYAHYANTLGRTDDLAARYLAYVQASPNGAMADDARWLLSASYEGADQFEAAITLLEPLRARGDAQATQKLVELYARSGRSMPTTAPTEALPAAAKKASEPPPPPSAQAAGRIQTLLDVAQAAADKGDRAKALSSYREVLAADAAHPEALAWVEDHLRAKRDFAALRDVLLAAVRVPGQPADSRRVWLREVAGVCEGNLRDVDGAIAAYKQLLVLDRHDEAARQALGRLLEKGQRWDDLANLLEQEATAEPDLEKKITLEKKIAALHEAKRKDPLAAAEAWARITNLTPEDEDAVSTAARLFEKGGALDRAAQVIAECAPSITDMGERGAMLEKLGALREKLNDLAGAGEAYASAAEASRNPAAWDAAERCFVAAQSWEQAGNAAVQRAEAETSSAVAKAKHVARAAEHYVQAGDGASALANLERASELDPVDEGYVRLLGERYSAASRWTDLATILARRAEKLEDRPARIATRKQLAKLYAGELADKDAARETWIKVLDDAEDKETLESLLQDAKERTDPADATALLRRLEAIATDPAERVSIALQEAEMLADEVGDVGTAIVRYERILAELDPQCRPALQAIADLEEAAENLGGATVALERELGIVSDPAQKAPIAVRLAGLYEQLGATKKAIGALEVVRKADPDDFDTLTRLCELCEKDEDWGKVAELLAQRIEVEADDAEISILTKRLSRVLADKLDRGDEALAVLAELADHGDPSIRAAYVDLGDRLGWSGVVGEKLVAWWLPAKPSEERTRYLRGAFTRFIEVGRNPEAVQVAGELAKIKGGADRELAKQLEELASKSHDLDALNVAHDLLTRDLAGPDRAEELVRQAEVRAEAGAPKLESMQHGEAGLSSVPPAEAEPLLARLSAIAPDPGELVGLYERQVSRCKAPADRVVALARAAQVASEHKLGEKARSFYELAIAGTPSEETLAVVEQSAREGDGRTHDETLRRALSGAMASGGQGARDGGRTRGALMRRAATMVSAELYDHDQAFTWLGDALIAHVEPATLEAVTDLAKKLGDPLRAEVTLGRALGEVFDGPLVRQLLARRAKLRREELNDRAGAAADLKKLHELSPSDQAVNDELSALLKELGDYRGIVSLYEDQILRGKDMSARAELARRVARMWEEELSDAREAADAWRRVLRMKQGDPEATAGLERSKANMLKKSEDGGEASVARSPSKAPSGPPPAQRASSSPPPPKRASSIPPPPAAHAEIPTPVPGVAPSEEPEQQEAAATMEPAAVPHIDASSDDAASGHAAGDAAQNTDEAPQRPARPSGLSFRPSGTDEVTMNDPLEGGVDVEIEHDTAPVDELPAHEQPHHEQDATPVVAEPGDLTPPYGIAAAAIAASEAGESGDAAGAGEEEVIIADDLAEMIDNEEHAPPPPPPPEPPPPEPPKSKRSLPPPLPRG